MKEWVEGILPLERELFLALNGSESHFLDNVMWSISGRFIWIPIYLFILFLFFYKVPRKEGILAAVGLMVVFALCDYVSSGMFKPFFERYRPTHHPEYSELVDIVKNYRGGRYGFISGHATNSFGLAVFISLLFKHRWVVAITLFWALLNSYTRIYLGVHFISDIMAGMIVGSLLALIVYYAYRWARVRVIGPSALRERSPYHKNGGLFALVLLIYLCIIVIFSSLWATIPH